MAEVGRGYCDEYVPIMTGNDSKSYYDLRVWLVVDVSGRDLKVTMQLPDGDEGRSEVVTYFSLAPAFLAGTA